MSHNVPSNLKYTKEHEWALIEGDLMTIGITDYAQSSLGDIVFVELPEIGTQIEKGSAFGVVESIKSVSDLYAPASGEVIESNTELESSPESINSNPYESWIIKIKTNSSSHESELIDANQYQSFCDSLE